MLYESSSFLRNGRSSVGKLQRCATDVGGESAAPTAAHACLSEHHLTPLAVCSPSHASRWEAAYEYTNNFKMWMSMSMSSCREGGDEL